MDPQRCSHCGTRRWNKDPFVGIADSILLEECHRRGILTDADKQSIKDGLDISKLKGDIKTFKKQLDGFSKAFDTF